MSIQTIRGLINPGLPLSSAKIESSMVTKTEPPESNKELISDIKNIEIVSHVLSEDLIKCETDSQNLLETKHSESLELEIRVLVKTDNASFVKAENLTENEKTENTVDSNVNKGTYEGRVQVQGLNEHFYDVDNLETNKQLARNFSNDLNPVNLRSRKSKDPENVDFAKSYRTCANTFWEDIKGEIKVIEAPVIPVEAYEYTFLTDQVVCNHCQRAFNTFLYAKRHIQRMHRDITRMFQCPSCPYNVKQKKSLQSHIIQEHKHIVNVQCFQCDACERKFKLKYAMTEHMKVDLPRKVKKNKLELCAVCGKEFKTIYNMKKHVKFVHNKEKRNPEIKCQEYSCEKCDFVSKTSSKLKRHKLTHKTEAELNDKGAFRFRCDKCDYKCHKNPQLQNHKLIHLKPEEQIQRYCCHHCSYKYLDKGQLKSHIFKWH